MSVDLLNELGQEFSFGGTAWCLVLNLAETYEWKPQGSGPPEDYDLPEPWSGRYDTNDGQVVAASDAAALALALERALASKDLHVAFATIQAGMNKVVQERTGLERGIEPFTPKFTQYLQEFIAFCRQGSFSIS